MANMALMAMAYGNNSMALMGIQWKSMEKLNKQCWFQLNSTYPSEVMAIWTFILEAYIVTYTLRMTCPGQNLPTSEILGLDEK